MSLRETLNLVDENDNLIGKVARDKAHAQGLWHRSATVFVFNKNNELLIQKRAPNMDWPNLWDASTSGHVRVGEIYEQTAQRELKEEIGIKCDFKPLGKIAQEFTSPLKAINKEHDKIFICQSDGPFKNQQEELVEVKFESVNNIKKRIEENSAEFTPGFIKEFKYYLEHK